MTEPAFTVEEGRGPLILAFPHAGLHVPDAIAARLDDRGRLLADADWHVDRLYAGLAPQATVIRARLHRYVIDLNRDPSGRSLYPGQATTELCPTTDFDGNPIWREGQAPTPDEIAERRQTIHEPYHAALAAQVGRVRALHGAAVLYDAHSIRSVVRRLFAGRLPDLNIGTNDGASCAPAAVRAAAEICEGASGYTHVLDGRFKGGWTTRFHGRPGESAHALQMELAQSTYLETEAPPFAFSRAKAARLRPVLAALLERLEALARDGALS
jgi:formiminoglutamase